MTNQLQQEKYNIIYELLNEEQQIAVNALSGAVMVIAGPGTGKTQILSARIGKILIETDTLPENILCLTYTDAGAMAMRKRLTQFIGADAYKVNLHTFHSFCNNVIQDNLSLFNKNNLDAISDLEKVELMKILIDSFPKNHALKRYRGDVYFEIENLNGLFASMKREGWTIAFIHKAIEDYLIQIIENKDDKEFYYQKSAKGKYEKGHPKASLEVEKTKMQKLKAGVDEFDNYQGILKKHNRYDFDDMINWVIKVLEENPLLLLSYQEQYHHILVDEFQDTSTTQNKIIELIYNEQLSESLFVVGDDDQSIYRFQGANIENMLQFVNKYTHDIKTIILTNNYRSTQPILNTAHQLISYNTERLVNTKDGLTKDLIAANSKINALTHLPLLVTCNCESDEMIFLTQEIEKLIAQNVKPSNISVIYKENKYGIELANYLRLKNIPYYSKRNINLLNEPLVKQIILVLKFLAAEHDKPFGGDQMLFEILHFSCFKIKPIEIAKLSVEVAAKQYGDQKTSIRKLLFNKVQAVATDLFDSNKMSPEISKASAIIENLITLVSNETLNTVFHKVIQTTSLLKMVMESPEKHWKLQIIKALNEFINSETSRNPKLNLQQFVTTIELMETEKLPLPLAQINGSEKGVNLLTTHGSKGLEFEYVFVAGCNAQFWEKKRKPNNGFKIPPTVFSSSTSSKGNKTEKDIEELRRLFYVAITRAEKYLTLSYSLSKNDGKPLEPSVFIEEIEQKYPLNKQKIEISDEQQDAFVLLHFSENARPEIEEMEEAFITPILEKFVMNVTALNNYLNCPLQFYYNNLVRIPTGKNEATEFGSAVHYALEILFKKMMDNNKIFQSKELFTNDFDWYMHRHRENFTQEQFDRRMEYGHESLSNYYDKYINTFNTIVSPEKRLSNIVIEGVPLKGMVDKLEFNGNSINVVDYKTGSHSKAIDNKNFEPPNEKNEMGGNYWRQAVFYKILIDNYPLKNWTVLSTEFDFVEPDEKKEYHREKIAISPSDITTVTQQIKMVWQKIQNKEFYIGCGKPQCKWCNLVKTNDLQIELHEVIEE